MLVHQRVTCWPCWARWVQGIPCSKMFKHPEILKEDSQSWPWRLAILCLLQEFGAHAKGYHKEFLGANETSIFSNSGGTDRTALLIATISWILQCHHRYHFIPFHTISWYIWRFFDILYHMYIATVQTKCFKHRSSGKTDSAGLRRDRSPEALKSRLKPQQLPLQLSPVNFVNWADLVWYLQYIDLAE